MQEKQKFNSKNFMYTIHEFHRLIQKQIENKLNESKTITFSQFIVLACFTCNEDEEFSQEKVAECSNITEATVSKHITTLVGLGYLAKEENKANRRKFSITITKDGIKIFKKSEKIIEKELGKTLASISEKSMLLIEKSLTPVITSLTHKK